MCPEQTWYIWANVNTVDTRTDTGEVVIDTVTRVTSDPGPGSNWTGSSIATDQWRLLQGVPSQIPIKSKIPHLCPQNRGITWIHATLCDNLCWEKVTARPKSRVDHQCTGLSRLEPVHSVICSRHSSSQLPKCCVVAVFWKLRVYAKNADDTRVSKPNNFKTVIFWFHFKLKP